MFRSKCFKAAFGRNQTSAAPAVGRRGAEARNQSAELALKTTRK